MMTHLKRNTLQSDDDDDLLCMLTAYKLPFNLVDFDPVATKTLVPVICSLALSKYPTKSSTTAVSKTWSVHTPLAGLSSSFEKFFRAATFPLSFSERSWTDPWRCSLCRSTIGFDIGLWSFSWLV
jgi:hypothetical protein